ncbi:hypothetical protein TVAG_280090 [Trichomonas vaginalis G3]|uniref:Uncharacterized protein n=1 Tax=Trichomonas vaginalis (strain ATCC PRA-98 / G3) TaxID=412133 RepID=A2FBM2_TRIV3|nr:Listeria-Bacteroides repeat domain (List Bact rpt) family [Trichomonas vaginalis G3]EAX97708.1 hypothetical protein TVAG_280090 [Trichomonas vaginalis G3]KAI5497062.1 Listeria-Bacteroides repeat domain (List Bact rpt) family [Trichomonas vaginalis G3]|eukprot:XP_001310638.1 hypothetical protein [Trichomonas vaginalis G3]
MFAFLTYNVLSDRYDDNLIVSTKYLRAYWSFNSYLDWTCFDIQYNEQADNNGYSWVQTTFANGGWFPVFTVDDNVKTKLLWNNRGKANYKGVYAETKVEKVPQLGEKYLLIKFELTNKDSRPHTVGLSSHTDVQIKYNDWATCYWYGAPAHRGLTMKDEGSGITLTLLVRGGYQVTDADKFWFGRWSGPRGNLHYFENYTSDSPSRNQDSAFSVSWQGHHIYPNQTLTFSVLMGVGQNLKNPSILTVNDNFQTNYNPNAKVTISGTVDDFDKNENVDVYYEFNGGSRQHVKHFRTNSGGYIDNGNWNFEITLGNDVNRYPIKVYAIDEFGLQSNVFERDLLVNEKPRVVFTKVPSEAYYLGGVVVVEGTIWDDTTATIKYQVGENGYIWETGQNFDCRRSTLPFRVSFPIPEDYIQFGHHNLYVWAEDEFGVKSDTISTPFEYSAMHAPEISLVTPQTEIPTVCRNQKFSIYFKAKDLDAGQTVFVYYKLPEQDPTAPPNQYFSFKVNDYPDGIEESYEYTVPNNFEFDHVYEVILFCVDSASPPANSADLVYKFKVVKQPTVTPSPIPNPPQDTDKYTNQPDSSYSGYISPSDVPTTTCTSDVDVNGDSYEWCYLTTTTIYLKTDIPPATPDPTPIPPRTPGETPAETPAPSVKEENPWEDNAQVGSSQKSKTNKKKMIIIGAAAGGVAAVAVVAAAVLIHEAIKPPKDFVFNDENGEFVEVDGNGAMENAENPIYDENGADDPFADEFDEDEAPVEGIFPA